MREKALVQAQGRRGRATRRAGRIVVTVLLVLAMSRVVAATRAEPASLCGAVEDLRDASVAAGSDPEADLGPQARAVAGLSGSEGDLTGVTRRLDAVAKRCGLSSGIGGAADAASLTDTLERAGNLDRDQIDCVVANLVADFGEDDLRAFRDRGAYAHHPDAIRQYLRLLVPCVVDPDPTPAPAAGPEGVGAAALAAEPASAAIEAETDAASDQRQFAPFVGWRLADYAGQHVHVSGGARQSVSSTAPDALDVWFFGGAGLFGSFQRDTETIPSTFAQEAADNGLAVRVRNLAVPGYSSYQEAVLFATMVTGEAPPDLVIFYDGFEDLEAAGATLAGLAFADEPSHVLAAQIMEDVESERHQELLADGDGLLARAGPSTDVAQVADQVTRAYGRSIDLAQGLGRAYDVPIVHLWAPDLLSKSLVAGELPLLESNGFGGARAEAWRAVAGAVRDQLPQGVIDLTTALDAEPQPLLADASGTNEAGARLLAAAIYDRVEPTLRQSGGSASP